MYMQCIPERLVEYLKQRAQKLTPSEKIYNSVQAACCRVSEMAFM